MRMTSLLLLCVLVSPAVLRLSAESAAAVDLSTRARGAARVVVGSVQSVRPEYQRNEFGDEIIVSIAQVRVNEVLKGIGSVGDAMTIDVEGGTVNGITLRVSDMPTVSAGDEAVFFVDRNGQGRNVPHLRGQGVLKLDDNGRVRGSSLTMGDVRQAVVNSRQAR